MFGIMKLMALSFICLMFMVVVGKVESRSDRSDNALVLKGPEKTISNHTVSKRGVGSLLFLGGTALARLGSLGINIASAVSKGCAFFPRICRNLRYIENVEDIAEKEKEEFRKMYTQHRKNFIEFRTAVTNNGYITFYINDTIANIESLSDRQSLIITKLETAFPGSTELERFTNESNFEDYILQLRVENLEYTLNDIRKMLYAQRNAQLTGMVVQLLIEAAVDRFISSFKTSYQQVQMEDLFYGSQLQGVLSDNVRKTKFSKFWQKLKIVPKVFKQMAINVKRKVQNTNTRIVSKIKKLNVNGRLKWRAIKNSYRTGLRGQLELKSNLKNVFKGFKRKVSSMTNKLKIKMRAMQTYTVSKTTIGTSLLGLVGDAVTIGLTMKAWKDKDEEIEEAKNSYDKYLKSLREERSSLESEIDDLKTEWKKAIQEFKNTAGSFKPIIEKLSKNTDFMDVIGLPGLGIKNTNILSVDFQNVRTDNIIEDQKSVIDFLRDNNSNLTSINEDLRARDNLYDCVITDLNQTKEIEILEMTKGIRASFRRDPSREVQEFGAKLTEKDVLCTVAILRPDKKDYDYYPLLPFRPICDVNKTLYDTMKKLATKERQMKIMEDVIEDEFSKENVVGLSDMLKAIQRRYEREGQGSFAKTITKRDILCRIAKKHTSLADYDFVQLSFFRNKCPAISDDDLRNVTEKAAKTKLQHKTISEAMTSCTKFNMCPCIPFISLIVKAEEDAVKAAIKKMYPEKKEYCGMGCLCTSL